MATEAQLQQGIVDVQGRRIAWNKTFDAIQQDGDGLSVRLRGRHLPAPNTLGQLPYADVRIDTRSGGQELGEITTTIIPAADVAWQNLANKVNDTRQFGLAELERLEDALNATLADLRAKLAAAGPASPSEQPGKDPKKLAPWIDFLASLVSWILVFWGFVILAQALGFFNWLVVAAFIALTFVLRTVLINPVKQVVLTIFGSIIQILNDLINFVVEWFNGILQYFQGDFLRAILQILEVAAFMYLWSFAQRIPVIGNLIKLITQAVGAVVNWINQTFDTVVKFLEWVRKSAEETIGTMFDKTTTLGRLLVNAFDQQIDRIVGGLESKLATLRFELIASVDIVRAFVNTSITVFGFRLQLVPEEVRAYLLKYGQANPVATFVNTADLVARAGPGFGTGTLTVFPPWAVADEMIAAMRGIQAGQAHDVETNALAMIDRMRTLATGGTPDPDELPDQFRNLTPPPPGTQPAPPPPGRPPWVPPLDWQAVQGICGADHVAFLAAAIGQHETRWGQLGAGRDGFILGVGVFGGVQQAQFRGLTNQLDWACPRLRSAFPGPGTVTRDAVIAFGRDVYQVPDPTTWGNDVFDLYASVFIPAGGTLA